DRRLADAASAREEVGVMEPLLLERVHERLHDVRLPDQLVEAPRPPFQCKNPIAQEISFAIVGGPRQPDPGTQLDRYRCSLPGRRGFTAWWRGGTDAAQRYFTSPRREHAIRKQCEGRDGGANARMQAVRAGDEAEPLQSVLLCRPRGRGRLRIRRGGRAVEGARLESVYTPKRRIEGSNPSLSASSHVTALFANLHHHPLC